MLDLIFAILVLLPILSAVLVYFARSVLVRNFVVYAVSALLMVASVMLYLQGNVAAWSHADWWGTVITVLDFGLLLVLLFIAWRLRNALIAGLVIVQIAVVAYLDFGLIHQALSYDKGALFFADQLSLTMVLIVSIIGSLIVLFAVPFMDKYGKQEQHHNFFAILLLFLGAMNALVLADNMLLLVLAWEITTLCSFLLIGWTRTAEAVKNATRALLFNSVGGVALVVGLTVMFMQSNSISLQALATGKLADASLLFALALFCIAGFTKAAQFPFQSWLLGAMVAPTPVSALLHSSTMVKAGVYLVVRLAPAYAETMLSVMVALVGAFTFVMASALAISQSNGKRILAYSTIANLGLIIVAAGINTPLAFTAAVFLIVFHAISKALLFLCVGTIEHGIGSKDVDDMHGLYQRMPFTAVVALIGMLTMFLPPFGMLLGKWATLEAASRLPLVVLMLAIGSALTMVFWLRWAGSIMTTDSKYERITEKQPLLIKLPLAALAGIAVLFSVLAFTIYQWIVTPLIATYYGGREWLMTGDMVTVGYPLFPLFAVLIGAIIMAIYFVSRASKAQVVPAYMCGATVAGQAEGTFRSHHEAWYDYTASNYYMDSSFGEERLNNFSNFVASFLLVLVIIAGVML